MSKQKLEAETVVRKLLKSPLGISSVDEEEEVMQTPVTTEKYKDIIENAAKRIENMEKRLADLEDKYSNSSKEVTVLKAKVRKLEEENLNLEEAAMTVQR